MAGAAAANALPEISIPGNENLRPETFGRKDLRLAAETADWRPQTEFPGAKPRKCRPIPITPVRCDWVVADAVLKNQSAEAKVSDNANPFADMVFLGVQNGGFLRFS